MSILDRLFGAKKDIAVLIADDEPAMRYSVAQIIREYAGRRPATIYTATGLDSLVEQASRRQYDAIITDNSMYDPHFHVNEDNLGLLGNEGIEATRRLRAAGSKTPIIMISGSRKKTEALEAGVDNYVEKFSWRGELPKLLRQYLG
jgi:CheY-like chemotaxis protein